MQQTLTLNHTGTLSAAPHAGRWLAGLLVAQFSAMWATFFILSSAIGWPASLDDPAEIALPRIIEQHGAVMLGYSLYLASALLIIPIAALISRRLALSAPMASLVTGLAVLSAVTKAIGITRWLFAMPVLADALAADPRRLGDISLIFDMLNAWAGGIGEVLGVSLVTGAWSVLVGALVLQTGQWFARPAGFGIMAGGALLLTFPLERLGIDLGPFLTIANIGWQVSLIGVAVFAARRP